MTRAMPSSTLGPMPPKALFQTDFGRWLDRKKVTQVEASKILDVTRQYIAMLATGKAEPALSLAAQIEDWSRRLDPEDIVTMHSFVGVKLLRAKAIGKNAA